MCIIALILNLSVAMVTDTGGQPVPKAENKLWAAVTVNEPVFEEGEVEETLMMHFALVNDGSKVVNPDLGSSKLLINRKELTDWNHQITQGPQHGWSEGIPPGEDMVITIAFGRDFKKPGIYKISWKGKDFRAPEIMFRVMPRKEDKR